MPDGFLTVSLAWIAVSLCALPFWISGRFQILLIVFLRRFQALPPPGPVWCRMVRSLADMSLCTGVALPLAGRHGSSGVLLAIIPIMKGKHPGTSVTGGKSGLR